MAPKQSGKNAGKAVALDGYDIYPVPSLDRAFDCPESVRKIFQLIHDTKNLQLEQFVERPKEDGSRSVFDTEAAHGYNSWLGRRANLLADCCCDPDMMD